MKTLVRFIFLKLRLLSKYHVPRGLILLIDAFLSLLALIFTFVLISSATNYLNTIDQFLLRFVIIFFIQLFAIVIFRSYNGIVRYTNLAKTTQLVIADC